MVSSTRDQLKVEFPSGSHTRTLLFRLALVSMLGLSFVVGLSVAASSLGISGIFLQALTILFLILCPVCAKGSGQRAVIAVGAITGIAAILALMSNLRAGSSTWLGDAAWGAIQVALVALAKTSRTNTNLSGALRIVSAQ